MRVALFFLLIFQVHFLLGQNNVDTLAPSIGINRVKEREVKIKAFVDSLNRYKGGVLPNFLYDKCFDLQSSLWQGFHSPISLRWEILEKVIIRRHLKCFWIPMIKG